MYKLITSNENKIKEFKNILKDKIEIVEGIDLKEVQGTYEEVIKYKALEAGSGFIVEDTILEVEINGIKEEVVDIKYKLDLFSNQNTNAIWRVSLGYNDGDDIYVFSQTINGKLINKQDKPNDAFGFDFYFVPEGSEKTLYELDKLNLKTLYSARTNVLKDLDQFKFENKIKITEIEMWNGDFQF